FIQSTAQVPAAPTGRATISDAFGEGHDGLAARRSPAVAAQPAQNGPADVVPVGGGVPDGSGSQGGAVVQAAMLDSQSAPSSMDEAAARERLQALEWELQFTDDHDAQDQLALEIARLRKQLSRSRR